jgi:hypothetical protein
MTITPTYEHIRSMYAPANWSVYCARQVSGKWIVDYGSTAWPSRSYWLVPFTYQH